MGVPVNYDEQIGKTVGRRVGVRHPLEAGDSAVGSRIGWQKAFKTAGVPRGVYRFKTHEEADAWLLNLQTRP